MGGTGANHIMLGYGSLIYYADANGHPATPPTNQIENPNPQPGTNNWYVQDGYRRRLAMSTAPTPAAGRCPDLLLSQGLPYRSVPQRRLPAIYYLSTTTTRATWATARSAPLGTQFTIPPTRRTTSALLLSKHHVCWKYYGEGWDGGTEDGEAGTFCNICNPFQYATQIMTNPALRAKHIKDIDGSVQRHRRTTRSRRSRS